jgi:glycosyltransferase involved in cell wall biosynthesis
LKIAYICYHTLDATFPLIRRHQQKHEIDVYLLLSQSSMHSTLIDLTAYAVKNGEHSVDETKRLVGKQTIEYLGPNVCTRLVILNSYYRYDPKNIALMIQFAFRLIKRNYDLVQFVGHDFCIAILNLLLFKKRKVHTIHEPVAHTGKPSVITRIQMWLLSKWGGSIILPSQISFDRFIHDYPAKIKIPQIIPFSVFEDYRQYKDPAVLKEPRTLLFFGLISPYKGVENLIIAGTILRQRNIDFKLVIAGEGKIQCALEDVVHDSRFEFINKHLSMKEIAQLNQRASAVVCPYRSASQSGVIMTAFAFGNPVIASDVGGIHEVIKDGMLGLLVPANNPEALASAIEKFLTTPDLAVRMRKNIQDKYNGAVDSWKLSVDAYETLYAELAGR